MARSVREKPTFENVQVARINLSDQVASQVQQMIVDGKLAPGDRLPPEREWAEQFGVSRTVIREVTKILQDRGLVKIMPGSGTYVSQISPEIVTQAIGLYLRGGKAAIRNLLEMRYLLETQIAALAAMRADESDISLLEDATQEMSEMISRSHNATDAAEHALSVEKFAQANMFFHLTLARACKNSLMSMVLQPIMQLMLESGWKLAVATGGSEQSLVNHRKIIESIRNRDVRACQNAMREDIQTSATSWARIENDPELANLSETTAPQPGRTPTAA
jgi:GntR family transcriptional regulator, transcriptional repressor for pyruvate dehydrogenase complex